MTNEFKQKLFLDMVNAESDTYTVAQKVAVATQIIMLLEEYEKEDPQTNHGNGD